MCTAAYETVKYAGALVRELCNSRNGVCIMDRLIYEININMDILLYEININIDTVCKGQGGVSVCKFM